MSTADKVSPLAAWNTLTSVYRGARDIAKMTRLAWISKNQDLAQFRANIARIDAIKAAWAPHTLPARFLEADLPRIRKFLAECKD